MPVPLMSSGMRASGTILFRGIRTPVSLGPSSTACRCTTASSPTHSHAQAPRSQTCLHCTKNLPEDAEVGACLPGPPLGLCQPPLPVGVRGGWGKVKRVGPSLQGATSA